MRCSARDVGKLDATGRAVAFILTFWVSAFCGTRAAAQDNATCLECHAKPGFQVERESRPVSIRVDPEVFGKSVHGQQDCTNCHDDLAGVTKWPHPAPLKRVECGNCHEEEKPDAKRRPVADYWASIHGQLAKAGDKNAPLCQDCHGSHDIVKLSERDSAISPFKIPKMCAQCHAEGTEARRTHDMPQAQVIERYKDSMHAEGLFKRGLVHTAVCTSCHTGHNILKHDDPKSAIHRDNIVATCKQCHGLIEDVHQKVVNGQLWTRQGKLPVCVECHSPHEASKLSYDTNMRDRDCLGCHKDPAIVAKKDGRSLFVDPARSSGSVHARKAVTCVRCHSQATPSPDRSCATITEKVNCAVCHEERVNEYRRGLHGQLHNRGDPAAPYCTECHGVHDTLEHEVPPDSSPALTEAIRAGATFSRNVPKLCGRCHREGEKAAVRYFGSQQNIVEHYEESIHGKGLLDSGLTVTATCTGCHSPHKELPASDPESTVNKNNIASTCGQCHDGIFEKYQRSVHSVAGNPDYEARRVRGMPELPHCNDCHTAHTVKRTDQPGFRIGIMDQCGKCHEDIANSYFETYHGKTSYFGDTTRAKCYDCHGAHDIVRTDAPESPLSRANIVQTCAKCHEGSHRQFAGYLSHATHKDPDKYPVLYYTFWGMTWLLIGVFTFFGLHTLAWLPRSWQLRKEYRALHGTDPPKGKQFVRFTRLQRQLHVTMIVSFFGLAITGMALKFSYTPWAQFLAKMLGGTNGAGLIHRLCAVVTFMYFFGHIAEVLSRFRKSGRKVKDFFFGPDSMMLHWRDAKEFWATLKWFFGKGGRPAYGRWTYWEKFDYLAVFWGVAVIGATGLFLWFPEFFTRFLPGQLINVATIIHSDEALLATGFIFTIHFFNTHFRPEKFPMDTVIFTGRMTVEDLKHDKPRLYQELVEKGELEQHLKDPSSPTFVRWARRLGFVALTVGFILVALIIYAMVWSYR